MNLFFASLVAYIVLLAAFTYYCVPKSWRRGMGTLSFVLLSAATFWVSFEAAGQPKPIEVEWRSMNSLPLIGFKTDEKAKVVYFWVLRDGVPITYRYPWNDNTEGLEDTWRARGQYRGLFLSDDEEAVVSPEENLPPKD